MKVHRITPILNVSDIQESFAWFEKLGFTKSWDWGDPATFGGICAGDVEIFLCQVMWPPTDMPWNVREMHVRHPDGHVFRISKGLEED